MNKLLNLVRKKSPLLREIPLNPPLLKGTFLAPLVKEALLTPPFGKGGWGDFFCQRVLRKTLPSRKLRRLRLMGACSLALYGCAAGPASGLSPQGTGAAQIARFC